MNKLGFYSSGLKLCGRIGVRDRAGGAEYELFLEFVGGVNMLRLERELMCCV